MKTKKAAEERKVRVPLSWYSQDGQACGGTSTMRTVWIPVGLLTAKLTLAREERKTVDTTSNDGRMDYIEFPATDIAKTKAFYEQVFGWNFTDYGPDYTSFVDGRLAGGFNKERPAVQGGPWW
jgi:hypothetical protein